MEKRKIGNLDNNFSRRPKKATSGEFIFGTRTVIEAIRAGKEIEKLLIQKGLANELLSELLQTAAQYHVPYLRVPVEKLNSITQKNHQGVVCFLSAIQYASLDNVISRCYEQGKDPFLVVLDRITDVRNFGALTRTAECAGVDAVVVPSKGGAQINSDAMKTSAGALNYLSVCREENLKNTISYLKDNGLQIIACSEHGNISIYDVDFNQPTAILMGSEEDGISPELLRYASEIASIPLQGKIESLNVSVAAGIVMYEAIRQKIKK